uniref:Uncharacterized protein n=1 Tax=Candidatus Kentrum sp. LFY TaxID=2126342 RepID=A0A450U9Z7_9GAMM|nr:MAG: hypothetical protein BECKLFY1418B_GA0070995_10136 [Candidatus Kentron sp. LFY]
MGPNALRYAGLDNQLRQLGYILKDYGNVRVPVRDTLSTERGLTFLPSVANVCEEIYRIGRDAITAGELPNLSWWRSLDCHG